MIWGNKEECQAAVSLGAIDHCGYDNVYATLLQSAQPFVQPNGHLVYTNTYRVVTAKK